MKEGHRKEMMGEKAKGLLALIVGIALIFAVPFGILFLERGIIAVLEMFLSLAYASLAVSLVVLGLGKLDI